MATADEKKERGAGGAKPRRRRTGSRRAELNRTLLGELHALRVDLDRLVERFELRLGGRLNELIAGLEGDPAIGQKPAQLPIRTAEAMLEAISRGKIRPAKARPKDFARMDALVREIADLAGE